MLSKWAGQLGLSRQPLGNPALGKPNILREFVLHILADPWNVTDIFPLSLILTVILVATDSRASYTIPPIPYCLPTYDNIVDTLLILLQIINTHVPETNMAPDTVQKCHYPLDNHHASHF